MNRHIEIVAFDADDTLWDNETFFQQIEQRFTELLSAYGTQEKLSEELFVTEMSNLERFGYGAKSFTLSMVETALRVSDEQIPQHVITELIRLGKSLLDMPIEPYEGVHETLDTLRTNGDYKLIVATKGDPRDQLRKLERSGLADYFCHAEIMHDKNRDEYLRLLKMLHATPENFLMIGNSLRSDCQPVLEIGGSAIYIPSEAMWQHEVVESFDHPALRKVERFGELLTIL